MIIPDRKKAATIILSKMNGAGAEKSAPVRPEVEMDEHKGALHAIAGDILSAIERKSQGDLVDALQAFCDEYDTEEDKEDDETAGFQQG